MTFPQQIELHPPASKMWAVKMIYSLDFFDEFVPQKYRQLKGSHWGAGICYRDKHGMIHMFFTMNYNLTEDLNTGEFLYYLSPVAETLLHLEVREEESKKYYKLIHEFPIGKNMDKHFVK